MEEADLSTEVQTQARRRVFSLKKANSALPLVRRIVADVVGLYQQMMTTQQQLADENANPVERESLEFFAEQQEEKLSGLIDELSEIGCELKDASTGLVDFIGRHDGRDVYLCWRLGEEGILHWHELHSGFAGRHPIASLRE